MKSRKILVLLAALMLAMALSCSEETPVTPDDEDPISWPGMTSRDDVIKTIVLCYANPKYAELQAKYNALLHSQYFFMLHADDVNLGESPLLTRNEDILSTEWIFTNEQILELTITPEEGTWDAIAEVGGVACSDCWETSRQYFIRAQFVDEGTIYQSPPERAYVRIVVAPDESDASRWVIRAMYDLGI